MENREQERAAREQERRAVPDEVINVDQVIVGMCEYGDTLHNVNYCGYQGWSWGDWRCRCGFHNLGENEKCRNWRPNARKGEVRCECSGRVNEDSRKREYQLAWNEEKLYSTDIERRIRVVKSTTAPNGDKRWIQRSTVLVKQYDGGSTSSPCE